MVSLCLFLSGLVMSCGGGQAAASSAADPTYTLSGTVTGVVPARGHDHLVRRRTGTVITSAGGTYSFSGLANGYYTVTASRANYKFTPASQVVPINYANAVAITDR